MKSYQTTSILFVLIASFINLKTSAQIKWTDFNYGLSLGTLIYQGDLTPQRLGYTHNLKTDFSLNISKDYTSNISLRANYTHGSLSANESIYSSPAYRQQRNFKFSTPVNELALHYVYNFQGINDKYNFHKVQTYIFAGAALTFLNITRDYNAVNRSFFDQKSTTIKGLSQDSVHKLPNLIPALPVGAGLKYIISPSFAATAEFTYRLLATDYLDGFKYAANKNKRDDYYGLSVGIVYSPQIDASRCPVFKYY